MDDLHCRVEFISPAFIGGPRARKDVELRTSSLRGALRYWLRALISEQDVAQLREAEGRIFGRTGKGGGASSVTVRAAKDSTMETRTVDQMLQGYPKPQQGHPLPGIHYALFSMKANNDQPARAALTGAFQFTLMRRPGVFSSQPMRRAYAALWCLTHLGSVGARSRRGFGALQVSAGTLRPSWAKDLPPLDVSADTPQALHDEIEQGLSQIRHVLGLQSASFTSSGYDMLAPGACRIFVLDRTFTSALDAVHAAVGALAVYRHLLQPDYAVVKTAMTGGPLSSPVQRAAFGLPIVFGFHDVPGRRPLEAGKIRRRSSPLWIRPVRLADGNFAVVLVFFKSALLPSGAQLSINHKNGPVPSLGLVEDFLTRSLTPIPSQNRSLPEQGIHLLEVML